MVTLAVAEPCTGACPWVSTKPTVRADETLQIALKASVMSFFFLFPSTILALQSSWFRLFNCHGWQADKWLFVLLSSSNFTEMSQGCGYERLRLCGSNALWDLIGGGWYLIGFFLNKNVLDMDFSCGCHPGDRNITRMPLFHVGNEARKVFLSIHDCCRDTDSSLWRHQDWIIEPTVCSTSPKKVQNAAARVFSCKNTRLVGPFPITPSLTSDSLILWMVPNSKK